MVINDLHAYNTLSFKTQVTGLAISFPGRPVAIKEHLEPNSIIILLIGEAVRQGLLS